MNQIVISLLTITGALGGVFLGSYLSSRSQATNWEREIAERSRQDRRSIYAAFAASAREWRAAVMDANAVITNASTTSRHPHAVGGQAQVESLRLRAEIPLASLSTETGAACDQVIAALGALSRARAAYEAGTVPDNVVAACRNAERAFLDAVRRELGIITGSGMA
jgi:hypothetical protein